MFAETLKVVKKDKSSLKTIETIILKYKKRIEKTNLKKHKLVIFSKKMIYFLKIIYFLDNLYLNLLRNNLYRILDKSIKDTSIRKLIKLEILHAPLGTFTEFVKLYNDIKQELYKRTIN